MVEEKRRFAISNLFRRATPTPKDAKVFNPGIQEKATDYMITSPVLYHVAQQSVIVRTCTTQLKNEIFRRGYTWDEAFAYKCQDCGYEHKEPVTKCTQCKSVKLEKPKREQLQYAHEFLEGYVNDSDQMFIDVLKELEDDLNIMDDAYIILKKEYNSLHSPLFFVNFIAVPVFTFSMYFIRFFAHSLTASTATLFPSCFIAAVLDVGN